jgi:hypothetical protein
VIGNQDEPLGKALAVFLVQPQVDVERPHESPAPYRKHPGHHRVSAAPGEPGQQVDQRGQEDEIHPTDDFSDQAQQQQHPVSPVSFLCG